MKTKDILKSSLIIYNGEWRTLKQSVLNKKEFLIASKFIKLICDGDYLEASQVQALQLIKYLNEDGKKLASKVLFSIYNVETVE